MPASAEAHEGHDLGVILEFRTPVGSGCGIGRGDHAELARMHAEAHIPVAGELSRLRKLRLDEAGSDRDRDRVVAARMGVAGQQIAGQAVQALDLGPVRHMLDLKPERFQVMRDHGGELVVGGLAVPDGRDRPSSPSTCSSPARSQPSRLRE